MKLYESEWKLMELLWASEPISARELARKAEESIGWNKNTSYTVLKKLVDKGAVQREEPNFRCSSLLRREDARREETRSLLTRLYGGSKKALFSALLEEEPLSEEERAALLKKLEP